MFKPRVLVLSAVVFLALAWRFLPNTQNFTPLGAVCLFAGAYFSRRSLAIAVPCVALFATDVVLNTTTYSSYGMQALVWQVPNYLAVALTIYLGSCWLKRPRPWTVALSAIGSAVLFYLVTNCVLLLWGHPYPYTWAGQMESYRLGIPFFRNMLCANLVFAPLLFGGFELARRAFPTALADESAQPAPLSA